MLKPFFLKKIQYDFYFILERLGRMHENKKKIFFFAVTKTEYFNTEFVSLQYKNTNRYWLKYSIKNLKKTRIFLK